MHCAMINTGTKFCWSITQNEPIDCDFTASAWTSDGANINNINIYALVL